MGVYPDAMHYVWSAEEAGGDTLTIGRDDPRLCRQCVLDQPVGSGAKLLLYSTTILLYYYTTNFYLQCVLAQLVGSSARPL